MWPNKLVRYAACGVMGRVTNASCANGDRSVIASRRKRDGNLPAAVMRQCALQGEAGWALSSLWKKMKSSKIKFIRLKEPNRTTKHASRGFCSSAATFRLLPATHARMTTVPSRDFTFMLSLHLIPLFLAHVAVNCDDTAVRSAHESSFVGNWISIWRRTRRKRFPAPRCDAKRLSLSEYSQDNKEWSETGQSKSLVTSPHSMLDLCSVRVCVKLLPSRWLRPCRPCLRNKARHALRLSPELLASTP